MSQHSTTFEPALVGLLAHRCTPGPAGDSGLPARSAVPAGVTVDLDELRAGLTGAGLLDTGGTLSAAETRRLACGARLLPLVLGGPSKILDAGRTRRLFSATQLRAMTARDRGCIAPGCDRPPAACEGHHQIEWVRGGPTDLDKGCLLCLFHHQQVHRQGWTVSLAPNGYPWLIPPTSIDPQQRPRQHHRYRLTLLTQRRRH